MLDPVRTEDWPALWAMVRAECDVAPVSASHANLLLNRNCHVYAKLPHWPYQMSEVEPWPLSETLHQYQAHSRLSKTSRVSTDQTPILQFLSRTPCQIYVWRKLLIWSHAQTQAQQRTPNLCLCLCLCLCLPFLRRLALKSVMASKKESVAKCAGPLQYGMGRRANTMIKTIQYLAESDSTRVLVALDLEQLSRTSHVVPCCTALNRTTQTLLLSSLMVRRRHRAQDARILLHQDHCQQRRRPRMSSLHL